MEDETKPQEGTETAPGAQQTDDAGSTSLEARMAVMEKELADARKENASWRRKLRDQEEEQKQAQEAKLKEEKKWQDFSDELMHQSREFYNFLKIREGSRILNIGMPV